MPLGMDTSQNRTGLPKASYTFKFEEVVTSNPFHREDSQYEKYYKQEKEEEARKAEIAKRQAEERAQREAKEKAEREKRDAEERAKKEA